MINVDLANAWLATTLLIDDLIFFALSEGRMACPAYVWLFCRYQ